MVLKKLGDTLTKEFHDVVEYLGREHSMQVVVEPHEHAKMVCGIISSYLLVCCCDTVQDELAHRIACMP